jgi:hypothetical protein
MYYIFNFQFVSKLVCFLFSGKSSAVPNDIYENESANCESNAIACGLTRLGFVAYIPFRSGLAIGK